MPIEALQRLLAQFKAGEQIFIPGTSAQPSVLLEALAAQANNLPPLNFVTSFIPGINPQPLSNLSDQFSEIAFFPYENAPRLKYIPLSYYGVCNYLYGQHFDWAVLHLSKPDQRGFCSLGTAAEFTPVVIANSKRLVGLINEKMPYIENGPKVDLKRLDYRIDATADLLCFDIGETDAVSVNIAQHLATLIDDNSVLQVGLGKVPGKLLQNLTTRKKLKIHSGLLSDGFAELADSGALCDEFIHTTCVALGSRNFYRWLKGNPERLRIAGVDFTHNPATLVAYDNLIAINSALQVDLLGQANLEVLDGRPISNVGGAADFARAARNARHGKSIIALPATASRGKRSRIVGAFPQHQVISLGRHDIDYVVTEYGIAELQGKSPVERAKALIEVAAPEFREALGQGLPS